jgi:hypothetical protein
VVTGGGEARQLRPVIVNGKTVICTTAGTVSAYFVRIWCKARADDKLYVKRNGEWRGPLKMFDTIELKDGTQFQLRRQGQK